MGEGADGTQKHEKALAQGCEILSEEDLDELLSGGGGIGGSGSGKEAKSSAKGKAAAAKAKGKTKFRAPSKDIDDDDEDGSEASGSDGESETKSKKKLPPKKKSGKEAKETDDGVPDRARGEADVLWQFETNEEPFGLYVDGDAKTVYVSNDNGALQCLSLMPLREIDCVVFARFFRLCLCGWRSGRQEAAHDQAARGGQDGHRRQRLHLRRLRREF